MNSKLNIVSSKSTLGLLAPLRRGSFSCDSRQQEMFVINAFRLLQTSCLNEKQ